MTVMVTGGAGLDGSECCRLFAQEGHTVIAVDNYMRGQVFGAEGDTQRVIEPLVGEFPTLNHVEADIRDKEKMLPLITEADVIIHAAAQP